MAARNSRKDFLENSYYHLYNRGVEKRKIYLDQQDYSVFLSYLKTYLVPKNIKALQSVLSKGDVSWREKDSALKLLRMNNFSDTCKLIAFCLMPNHFHLLIYQTELDVIDRFMNSLLVRYAMYFNRKYKRVGRLFQGVYRAVKINNDEQLIHLTRYIHRNPLPKLTILASQDHVLRSYEYSSYRDYLLQRNTEWVRSKDILGFFQKTRSNSYESFVEESDNVDAVLFLKDYTLDEE